MCRRVHHKWSLFKSFLPAATKLGQGNIFTRVCQEFCPREGGRVSASVHAGIYPPEQTPPDQTPPRGSRLQHTVNERPVRILLECILLICKFKVFFISGGSRISMGRGSGLALYEWGADRIFWHFPQKLQYIHKKLMGEGRGRGGGARGSEGGRRRLGNPIGQPLLTIK